ncbi:MAG: hypothetical protein DAHOPDDO_01276 [Ignavibacteriaceae bacterium]|nr:hypothetical protein [Ignavibacteriaceae bacterium]
MFKEIDLILHNYIMSIVVDTSVVVAILTNEVHKNQLIELTKGVDLLAPESINCEIGNAFSTMFKRGRLTLNLAKKALEYYKEIPIRLVNMDIEKSLEIAYKHKIYAYDAYFIECAIRHQSEMISLDDTLIKVAKKEDIIIREVRQ